MAERTQAQAYVQEKAAASGSSFYYAFLFLPASKRQAITAFYAFCREVDDVVDETSDMGVAEQALNWWQQEVVAAYQMPDRWLERHPVFQALMPHAATYGIAAEHLLAVIRGCQMDLTQQRYATFEDLKGYCHLVAGVVGEVIARILGYTDAATISYAHQLGLALQMTNIMRDVGEDIQRGRLYLPVDELQRFAVPVQEIEQGTYSSRFSQLMQFQYERAEGLYCQAFDSLPAADFRAQKPGLMMGVIYRDLLRVIAKDGFQVLHQRTVLTPLRKLWLAWKVQALGRV